MTIETKFNVGETVWFMYNNKPWNDEVIHIRGDMSNSGKHTVRYRTHCQTLDDMHQNYVRDILFAESDLFKSKADLLNSL